MTIFLTLSIYLISHRTRNVCEMVRLCREVEESQRKCVEFSVLDFLVELSRADFCCFVFSGVDLHVNRSVIAGGLFQRFFCLKPLKGALLHMFDINRNKKKCSNLELFMFLKSYVSLTSRGRSILNHDFPKNISLVTSAEKHRNKVYLVIKYGFFIFEVTNSLSGNQKRPL